MSVDDGRVTRPLRDFKIFRNTRVAFRSSHQQLAMAFVRQAAPERHPRFFIPRVFSTYLLRIYLTEDRCYHLIGNSSSYCENYADAEE